jgi:hypothetical protein
MNQTKLTYYRHAFISSHISPFYFQDRSLHAIINNFCSRWHESRIGCFPREKRSNNNLDYSFPRHRPNAQIMCSRSTTHPCPIGILRTADTYWKTNETRHFFGNSYSSPTPSIYTIQQLGLGITKAFSTHIRNATRTYISPNTPMNSNSQDNPDTDPFMPDTPLM